jgi:hypothetical protein
VVAGADPEPATERTGKIEARLRIELEVIGKKLGKEVARPERLELPTLWFEARCSIQLSYGRV